MIEYDKKEVYLYGAIGDEITATSFREALKGIEKDLDLYISSPGGDVEDGTAIINQLRRFKETGGKVNVFIDALAASMASGIAMEGDTVSMAENSLMMIHAPWTVAIGNADDFRATAEMLDKVQDALSLAYQHKSGKTSDELAEILKNEVWLSATEAVEQGFADYVIGPSIEARVNNETWKWENCPENLLGGVAAYEIKTKEKPDFSEAKRAIINKMKIQSIL